MLLCGCYSCFAARLRFDEDGRFVDESVRRSSDGVCAALNESSFLAVLFVLLSCELGEAPRVTDDDILSARELVLRTAQRLQHVHLVRLLRAHTEDDLTNVHASDSARRLAVSLAHTRLKTETHNDTTAVR